MNGQPTRSFTQLAMAIIVAGVVIGAGIFASFHFGTATTVTRTTTATKTVTTSITNYGAVSFSSSWHYVVNVTLSGTLSACEALRFPCPSNPTSQAEQFTNGTANIYAEGITGCQEGSATACITWTIIISNNSVYCITPPVSYAPQCPSVINSV